jgi:hypothetical protein
MLEELFGDRNRPLFDQARPIPLEPLGDLAVAEYIERRFADTSRSAGPSLDTLIALAAGHPQRAMMLAHHLWEHTPRGEHATEDSWHHTVDAVYAELQEQYERLWASHADPIDRVVLQSLASGIDPSESTVAAAETSSVEVARARDRLLQSGDLRRGRWRGFSLVDPLYARWITEGRRPPPALQRQLPPATREVSDSVAPFGIPDGARASLGALAHGYFELGASRNRARDPRDLSVRVIVGRKGSGKTIWLRRQHASASAERSLYVADIDQTPPATSDVVRVSAWYPRALLTETWSAIWRVALLRMVASHIGNSRHLGPEDFGAEYGLWRQFRHPSSLGSQAAQVIREHISRRSLDAYLLRPEWDQVKADIGNALHELPPMLFTIDALDEEFRHAPAYWTAAQKGALLLFPWVM